VEEQDDYKEPTIMTTQNETAKLIQGSLSRPEETKELQEKDEDNQNFQPTSGQEDQVQGKSYSDTYAVEHSITVADGLWTELSQEEISYWVERSPSQIQYSSEPFFNSKRVYKNQSRFCTKALFHSTKSNGETYNRVWLVYSPSKGRVYCFVCKLFPNTASSDIASVYEGFYDWKNSFLIQTHENTENHRNAMLTYLIRMRGKTNFRSRETNKSRTALLEAYHGENYRCNMHTCRTRLSLPRRH